MADNIFKVFRPDKKDPQCLKRGMWYNDTPADRLEHVKEILKLYKERFFDWNDLVWHLKYAVTGNIYVSEEVYNLIITSQNWQNYLREKSTKKYPDCYDWLDKIIKHNTLKSEPYNTFDDGLLEIHGHMNKILEGKFIFEHVIPANVYLKRLVELYDNNKLGQATFDNFRKLINVCIITAEEDKRLNKEFKQAMPAFNWEDLDPFIRYKNLAEPIKIHEK